MSIQGLSKDKCEQRNRIASRMGIDTVPMRFVAAPMTEQSATEPRADFLELRSQGKLPDSSNGVMNTINALLPEGATPLVADDVYVHFLEAANSNFIGDRFMYLGKSTLQNIAKEAALGVAFMNSHRTGGLSAPAELPFGKTFAGQFQSGLDEAANTKLRAMVGAYMLRDVRPNGSQGPSTDDLHRMISGGTVADVSVGLHSGERVCNVCNHGLFDEDDEGRYLCLHVPGTHYEMDDTAIAAEIGRDASNKDGLATFTLENAHFSEVSPVYDGAVPGAGVKKVLSLAAQGELDDAHLQEMLTEANRLYADYLPEKFKTQSPKSQPKNNGGKTKMSLLNKIAAKLGIEEEELHESEIGSLQSGAPVALQGAVGEILNAEELAQLRADAAAGREALAGAQNASANAFAAKHAALYLENGDEETPSDRANFTAKATAAHLKTQRGEALSCEELEALFAVPKAAGVLPTEMLSASQMEGATAHKAAVEPADGVDQNERKAALRNSAAGQSALKNGTIQIPDAA